MKYRQTPLDCKKASSILGISEQRVRKLCKEGILESEKVGASWLLNEESVISYGWQRGHISAQDHRAAKSGKGAHIALSFFSGAMGMDLGLERAGFDVRLACEVDKYCRQTIAINRPETALLGDISQYGRGDVLKAAGLDEKDEIDLVVGGPPCQAFSTAGKRQGLNDERGNVFLKYVDLAISLNPKFIVIENVRGLLSCPLQHRPHENRGENHGGLAMEELKGGALNLILLKLRSSGYEVSFNLYNAANFGSPQIRERVVMICSRDCRDVPYLTPTHSSDDQYDLPPWRIFKDAVKGIETHTHIEFPASRLKYYRLLKSGQNWRNLPEPLQREALGKSYFSGGGKTGFLRRLAWDKPAPTLVTHPAMPATDLAHPSEDRPLSIEEYKRVQEFPDDWQLAGPLIQQYKQVGNAVPVSLGTAIGRLVLKLIDGKPPQSVAGFPYSRYRRTSHLEWEDEFCREVSLAAARRSQLDLV